MCFHWQGSALKIYEEGLKPKNLFQELGSLNSQYQHQISQYNKYRDKHNNSTKQKILWIFNFLIFKPIYSAGNLISPKLNWYVCKVRPDSLVYFTLKQYPEGGFYGGSLYFVKLKTALVEKLILQLS